MENRVRARRLQLRKTQKELSGTSGVPASTLAEIESGRREPKIYTAARIAHALNCSLEFLFPVDLSGF